MILLIGMLIGILIEIQNAMQRDYHELLPEYHPNTKLRVDHTVRSPPQQ